MSSAERAGRGGDDAGSAKGFGGTKDGADIARVLKADEDEDKREAADEVVEASDAGVDKRGNALRRFGGGDGGEEAVGSAQETSGRIELRREAIEIGSGGQADEDGFDGELGAEGFFDEMET